MRKISSQSGDGMYRTCTHASPDDHIHWQAITEEGGILMGNQVHIDYCKSKG